MATTSKAKSVGPQDLGRVRDPRVQMSLVLQQAFGLRREEAIKFIPGYADRGDHALLKESWTKGGKARAIPVRTEKRRAVLDRAHRPAGKGSLIPSAKNYRQQLRVYEAETSRAGPSPKKNILTVIATLDDMMRITRQYDSCQPWHGKNVASIKYCVPRISTWAACPRG